MAMVVNGSAFHWPLLAGCLENALPGFRPGEPMIDRIGSSVICHPYYSFMKPAKLGRALSKKEWYGKYQ